MALASLIALLIAYPAAYFVARFAGRRKALFLILLIAPFWISYMMRMLAWIDLLQTDGYVNKALFSRPARFAAANAKASHVNNALIRFRLFGL